MDIADRLREIIKNISGCNAERITDNCLLGDDLGCDSLDAVELMMEIEEAFDLVIPDDEPIMKQRDCRFSDVVKLVESRVGHG